MINKEEMLKEIQGMTYRKRYDHVMSALETVLQEDEVDSQAKRDATAIIRLHVKINKEVMMETAGMRLPL